MPPRLWYLVHVGVGFQGEYLAACEDEDEAMVWVDRLRRRRIEKHYAPIIVVVVGDCLTCSDPLPESGTCRRCGREHLCAEGRALLEGAAV